MALKFKIGDEVRQVMPKPFQGKVVEAVIVDSEIQFRVEHIDENGDIRAKFFNEEQIEAVMGE